MSNPWLKFYTSDWRSDPALRMCSMAARGLWIELVCLMHEAHPYGHLLVNGLSPTDTQLAVLVGAPSDQVSSLIGELEAAGVFSRTRAGVIFSRRLTRMAKKAATARNNGRKGGNPSLIKETENPPPDNPPDKDRDKTQKPEARSQINSVPDGTGDAAGQTVDFTKEVFDRGVAFLGKYQIPQKQARALIGKWRSEVGDTETFNALRDANREGVTDPVSWISKRFSARKPNADVERVMDEVFGRKVQ